MPLLLEYLVITDVSATYPNAEAVPALPALPYLLRSAGFTAFHPNISTSYGSTSQGGVADLGQLEQKS